MRIELCEALTIPSSFERRLLDAAYFLEKREMHDEAIVILQGLRQEYSKQSNRLQRKYRIQCLIHIDKHPLKAKIGEWNLLKQYRFPKPTEADLDALEQTYDLLDQLRFDAPARLRAYEGDFQLYLTLFRKAFKVLSTDLFEVRYAAQNLLYLQNDFEKGLKIYRPQNWDECTIQYRPLAWRGEPLKERTVLFALKRYIGCGWGDIFNFIWFCQRLEARGAKVLVDLSPSLERLIRYSFPNLKVWQGETFDFYIRGPFHVLQTFKFAPEWRNPPMTSYLKSPASQVNLASIENRLNLPSTLRVGVCWTSSDYSLMRTYKELNLSPAGFRSIEADMLAPLFQLSASFYSLVKDEEQSEKVAAQFGAINLSRQLEDFCETAGVIAQLDLVITVDTAIAHLAAALGKPTWLLLNKLPDWRWGLDGDRSLWYSSLRLFRCSRESDWTPVVNEVCQRLNRLLKQGT